MAGPRSHVAPSRLLERPFPIARSLRIARPFPFARSLRIAQPLPFARSGLVATAFLVLAGVFVPAAALASGEPDGSFLYDSFRAADTILRRAIEAHGARVVDGERSLEWRIFADASSAESVGGLRLWYVPKRVM